MSVLFVFLFILASGMKKISKIYTCANDFKKHFKRGRFPNPETSRGSRGLRDSGVIDRTRSLMPGTEHLGMMFITTKQGH